MLAAESDVFVAEFSRTLRASVDGKAAATADAWKDISRRSTLRVQVTPSHSIGFSPASSSSAAAEAACVEVSLPNVALGPSCGDVCPLPPREHPKALDGTDMEQITRFGERRGWEVDRESLFATCPVW
jgi:hypothetical protein